MAPSSIEIVVRRTLELLSTFGIITRSSVLEMEGLWDILGKAAILAQLVGLDAAKLITMAARSFHEMSKECRKLDEASRALRNALLHSPAGSVMLGAQVTEALEQAHGLVVSYQRSSLVARLRRSTITVAQLRDMRGRIQYHRDLVVAVKAALLAGVQPLNLPPPPPPSLGVIRAESNVGGEPTSIGGSTDDAPAADAHVIIDIFVQEE